MATLSKDESDEGTDDNELDDKGQTDIGFDEGAEPNENPEPEDKNFFTRPSRIPRRTGSQRLANPGNLAT